MKNFFEMAYLLFHSQVNQIHTIVKGKHQRKRRTHQILLIFLAVLTQLFWLPLSVNHLHITNLIQHFLPTISKSAVSTLTPGMQTFRVCIENPKHSPNC